MTKISSTVPAVSAPVQSPADAPPGLLSVAAKRLTNWLKRRRLARIEELDDHLLDDIGLIRSDLAWVRTLSLDHDPLAALNGIARRRRASLFEGRTSPLSRTHR